MNERVMQFRIGMFVIVAGLVLTMLVVWFGESPRLFHDQVYVVVHYLEAPGVAEGIPVRKSGIRVGEVTAITFDERPDQPDGVLVTLSLDSKYRIRAGSVPRLSRSLIGDVTIDLLPGLGPGLITGSQDPADAPIIEGAVAPDPSKALEAASSAFEKAGLALSSINQAAAGIAELTKSAGQVGEMMTTWNETGKKLSTAAEGIDRFIKANEQDITPTIANIREVSQKLNGTFDPQTQEALRAGIVRFNTAAGKLETLVALATPLFQDLGGPTSVYPKTDTGQAMRQMNLITRDVQLLTRTLSDGQGNLNPNGTLQKLMTRTDLYENLNRLAATTNETMTGLKPILTALRNFANKIANDPSLIGRSALRQ